MEEDDLESSSDPSSFLIAEESTVSGENDLSLFHFLSSFNRLLDFTIFHAELLSLSKPLTSGATILEIWLISPLFPFGILLGVDC